MFGVAGIRTAQRVVLVGFGVSKLRDGAFKVVFSVVNAVINDRRTQSNEGLRNFG